MTSSIQCWCGAPFFCEANLLILQDVVLTENRGTQRGVIASEAKQSLNALDNQYESSGQSELMFEKCYSHHCRRASGRFFVGCQTSSESLPGVHSVRYWVNRAWLTR